MKSTDTSIQFKTASVTGLYLNGTLRSAMGVLLQGPPIVLLLLMLVYPGPVRAGLEKRCNLEDRLEGPAPGGLCGSRIPEVIRLNCMFHRPRRSDKKTGTSKTPDEQKDFSKLKIDKSTALTYLLKRNSGNQGITCECCYNLCTPDELLQYC